MARCNTTGEGKGLPADIHEVKLAAGGEGGEEHQSCSIAMVLVIVCFGHGDLLEMVTLHFLIEGLVMRTSRRPVDVIPGVSLCDGAP